LVTDAIKNITGYAAEEFYKKPELWEEIIYDGDKNSVWKAIERHRKDKVPLKMNYRIVTKAGDIKWLKDEAIPVLDQSKKIIRIDGFLEDITELKKIRDQMRYQSELVQNVSDAIISMDLDFKILSWNTAAEKVYGWTEKEVIGKHLVDLVKPVYNKVTRDQVLKNFYKVGHWAGEMIQKRKDGKDIVIQSSGSYIKDIAGKPIGIVTVNRDVTSFKEVEKKIEDIARFPSQNPHPVLRIDMNGTILYANSPGKKFVKSWSEKGKNYIPGFLKKSIDEALKSKKNKEVEVSRDNKTFLFSIVPIPDEEYVNIYGMDISTEVEVRNAFKKNEEQYRLAQRAANVGSWDWNIITGTLEWSEIIEPLFGFKHNRFGGKYEDFLNCIHPDDRQFVIDSVNACVKKDVDYDIEHRIVWPDGSVHWVRETGDVIRDKSGKAVRMLGIVQEITDRKKIEEDKKKLNGSLLRYTNELAVINKELEAFSYSVSHDLRAPLRSIDGFSQALVDDYADKLDAEGKDYIARVRKATQHMGRIIDDLLKLSRITRHPLEKEKVDIADLSKSIIADFKKEDSKRNVKFDVSGDLVVMGDKHLLSMALENLIGNSWKFTSKNPNAKIEVGKTRKDDKDVFFVRDNGAGFDMKYSDKLFIPFQRLHSDDEFPGIGIGLGIVSRIIHRHGGSIWAEGEVGKGAIFYFTLGGKKYE
jgi:PAS domain S-box-containing protein